VGARGLVQTGTDDLINATYIQAGGESPFCRRAHISLDGVDARELESGNRAACLSTKLEHTRMGQRISPPPHAAEHRETSLSLLLSVSSV